MLVKLGVGKASIGELQKLQQEHAAYTVEAAGGMVALLLRTLGSRIFGMTRLVQQSQAAQFKDEPVFAPYVQKQAAAPLDSPAPLRRVFGAMLAGACPPVTNSPGQRQRPRSGAASLAPDTSDDPIFVGVTPPNAAAEQAMLAAFQAQQLRALAASKPRVTPTALFPEYSPKLEAPLIQDVEDLTKARYQAEGAPNRFGTYYESPLTKALLAADPDIFQNFKGATMHGGTNDLQFAITKYVANSDKKDKDKYIKLSDTWASPGNLARTTELATEIVLKNNPGEPAEARATAACQLGTFAKWVGRAKPHEEVVTLGAAMGQLYAYFATGDPKLLLDKRSVFTNLATKYMAKHCLDCEKLGHLAGNKECALKSNNDNRKPQNGGGGGNWRGGGDSGGSWRSGGGDQKRHKGNGNRSGQRGSSDTRR